MASSVKRSDPTEAPSEKVPGPAAAQAPDPSPRPADGHPRRRFRQVVALLAVGAATLGTGEMANAASTPEQAAVSAQAAAPDAHLRTTMWLDASYHLETFLRYDAARLDVTETIEVVNRSTGTIDALHLSVLARAYGELRIESVLLDGTSSDVRFPNPTDMLVALPGGLDPAAKVTVVVHFSAHPSGDTRDSLRSRLSTGEGMMRVADWYPILSNRHDLRNPGDSQFSVAASSVTLDLTTDRPLAVAAPGTLVERHGLHRVYRLDDARNYAFTVAPRLRTVSTITRDGVRVRVFHPRGVPGRAALREARRALETYDEAYGEFPWPELILAPTPGGWIATEWPSIVFLGTDVYTDADTIHHEVAHQWFYALLGNDQMQAPWLDEAFAEFSTRYFFGEWDRGYCSRRKVDSSVYDFPNTLERWNCDGYVETVYKKGAAMVDGVRARMGTRAFFRSMRTLIRENRFGVITAPIVVSTWERYTARPRHLDTYLRRFLGASQWMSVANDATATSDAESA
jgi:hypothetical protein